MKTVNLDSAASVARAISRRLRKAGLLMSVTTGKAMSEGLYVHRVGCGNLVSVNYWLRGRPTEEEGARRNDAMKSAERILEEAGYPFNRPYSQTTGLYVTCLAD